MKTCQYKRTGFVDNPQPSPSMPTPKKCWRQISLKKNGDEVARPNSCNFKKVNSKEGIKDYSVVIFESCIWSKNGPQYVTLLLPVVSCPVVS